MRTDWMPAFSIASTSGSSISVPASTMTLAGDRMVDVVQRRTAENAHAERGHDLTGIDDRLHGQALVGAAIDLR